MATNDEDAWDLMGSWNGPMGPLLRTRSGQATVPSEMDRCKTSTRSIKAKTQTARKIHQPPPAAVATLKLVLPSPAMKRRNSQQPGPDFMPTRTGSQPGPMIMRTVKGTLSEILAMAPALARESGEKAHETPMRQRQTQTPLLKSHAELSEGNSRFTRTQSAVMKSFEGHMANLLQNK